MNNSNTANATRNPEPTKNTEPATDLRRFIVAARRPANANANANANDAKPSTSVDLSAASSAAAVYRAAGLRVVPLHPEGTVINGEDKGKTPTRGGFGAEFPEATWAPEHFRANDGIAILCGPCPAAGTERRLLGLDLDKAMDRATLEGLIGPLPETLTSKGWHHAYYWIPADSQLYQRNRLLTVQGGALDTRPSAGGYLAERGNWDRGFDLALVAELPEAAHAALVAAQGERAGQQHANAPIAVDPSPGQDSGRDGDIAERLAALWQHDTTGETAFGALGGWLCRSRVSLERALAIAASVSARTGATGGHAERRVQQAYSGTCPLGFPALLDALAADGGRKLGSEPRALVQRELDAIGEMLRASTVDPDELDMQRYCEAERAACRRAPGEVLPDVEIKTYPHAEQQRLFRQLNDRHCVLNAVGGKVRVLSWRVGHHGAAEPVLQTAEDFRARYAGLYVKMADDKRIEVAKAWLASPARRRANTLTFRPDAAPGAIVDGDLNLWQGYAVKPAPGDCSRFKAFVRDVICSGDAAIWRYVWSWLCWTVQHPGERAEVALALRGGKGTGKNTLLDTIRDLFGAHGQSVSNAKHLTGNFNRHLAGCAFLVVDEALAVADKQAEAVLKTLITGSTLQIERKGVDLESATNCLTLAFASNDEWFVPASGDERRFCVVDVNPARQQDKPFFVAIHSELANGGREALLHALLSEPLGDWHPRDNVPQTAALRDQQVTGLRGSARLVHEYLATGRVPGATWADTPGAIAVQPAIIMRNEPAHRLRGVTEVHLGRELAKCGAERKRARSGGAARSWQRVLPPLAEARAAWTSATGLSGLVWDPVESWEVDGPPQVSASAAAAAEVN